MTKAFAVFIKESTRDESELDRYQQLVPKSFENRQVVYHAAYGRHQVLEGPEVEGVVILEFPDMEAANAWYSSPEYAAAREHRFKGATYRAVFVEGLENA